jgi:hypothetical protein
MLKESFTAINNVTLTFKGESEHGIHVEEF